mmetsp:Transcript_37595/g.41896  ORF Transcript_37595/g.41896 Transcript_37595/m.41896 type:complete len:194 (+) Transcript_37595:79-660(+)
MIITRTVVICILRLLLYVLCSILIVEAFTTTTTTTNINRVRVSLSTTLAVIERVSGKQWNNVISFSLKTTEKKTKTTTVSLFSSNNNNNNHIEPKYNEIAPVVVAPIIADENIPKMNSTKDGIVKLSQNQQEEQQELPLSTTGNTPQRKQKLQLYEDDMGNFSMEHSSSHYQIQKEQKETWPGFRPVDGCLDM